MPPKVHISAMLSVRGRVFWWWGEVSKTELFSVNFIPLWAKEHQNQGHIPGKLLSNCLWICYILARLLSCLSFWDSEVEKWRIHKWSNRGRKHRWTGLLIERDRQFWISILSNIWALVYFCTIRIILSILWIAMQCSLFHIVDVQSRIIISV